jgi:ketosteroid isomerase-like protein
MKTHRIIAGLAMIAASATHSADRHAELAAVVQAERDFAARAQVVNARQAFAENFAPDSIVYGPFPAPAFPALGEPAADWPVNIQWRPAAAAISGAGDMGYTTGPAEFRKTSTDPPHRYGHYTSVWERQPDGRYEVVIDVGIDHPGPVSSIPDWTPPVAPPHAAPAEDENARGAARQDLLALDAEVGEAAATDTVGAISRALADDGRYHQAGALPSLGRSAAVERLRASRMTQRWAPAGGKVAQSADFGFTYGKGSFTQAEAPAEGEFAYLNIWQKRDGAWKLLVRVVNPVAGR